MSPSSNGNGRSMWAAMSICSGVVLAIGGAFGSSYVRDQTRTEARVTELEDARVEAAYSRGKTDQRLDQIQALAETNRDNITLSFKELDSKLQREMNLADATIEGGLRDLDGRLQDEIRVSRDTRKEQIDAVVKRLEILEGWMRSGLHAP